MEAVDLNIGRRQIHMVYLETAVEQPGKEPRKVDATHLVGWRFCLDAGL